MLGNIEWQDKQKSRCLVMWRTPQEWGQLILQWVSQEIFLKATFHIVLYQAKNNGLENSVCTLYEIHSGEDSENEGCTL